FLYDPRLPELSTLSLHDALPICLIKQIQYQSSAKAVYSQAGEHQAACGIGWWQVVTSYVDDAAFDQEIRIEGIRSPLAVYDDPRSEEHTSELQSRENLVCRLLLE